LNIIVLILLNKRIYCVFYCVDVLIANIFVSVDTSA